MPLSGKGRIGEKTRNRILEVAKRGEEREEMARTRTVTHNIGVVLPQTFIMEAVFISRTVCSASANRHRCSGTNVLITTSNAHDISELQSLVESNRVDGMLLTRALEDDRALSVFKSGKFPDSTDGNMPV